MAIDKAIPKARLPFPVQSQDTRAFWEVVFGNFRSRTYDPEPRVYTGFRVALEAIRKRSGMTLEDLAKSVGISYSALMAYDARNGSSLHPELCARFKFLALDYDMSVMARWFEQREREAYRRHGRRDKRIVGKLNEKHEREYEG